MRTMLIHVKPNQGLVIFPATTTRNRREYKPTNASLDRLHRIFAKRGLITPYKTPFGKQGYIVRLG